MVDLLFSQPAAPSTGPVHLVFGNDTSAPTKPDAVLSSVLQITGLRGHIALKYDSNVARPLATSTDVCWQATQPMQSAALAQYSASVTTSAPVLTHWQATQLAQSAVLHTAWRHTQPLQSPLSIAWQQAQGMGTGSLQQHWQVAMPLQTAVLARHSDTQGVQSDPLFTRWQDAWRDHAVMRTTHIQGAAAQVGTVGQCLGSAADLVRALDARHQDARPLPNGRSLRPPPMPPRPPPCYIPTLPVRLLFADPADRTLPAKLRFVCEGRTPQPPAPSETIIIPTKRVYIVRNHITLHRLDTGDELHAHAFGMSLDYQSWTWQWQASLHSDAEPLLGRDNQGDPPILVVEINGIAFKLRLEQKQRDRRFNPTRWSVSGRGLAAVLSDPWSPKMSFGNTDDRTAQQLMQDVLTVNNASLGWDIDWGLIDWLVPAGAWAFQGNYMAAINDIAGAVGGYLQPHPTEPVLRVLPKYPKAPWEWDTLSPDFEIPANLADMEGTAYLDKPAYNRVFVGGEGVGVFGPITRAGTAGNVLAPQVLHPLITHADAHRQRGLAELSDTGPQEHITLKMQVLPEAGVITPGQLVRYVGHDKTYLGMVRATAIDWSRPVLRQTLKMETHHHA